MAITVAELIERLRELPQDSDVWVYSRDNGDILTILAPKDATLPDVTITLASQRVPPARSPALPE